MCVGPPARVQTRPLGTERALPLSRFLASGHAHCVHDCQAAKDQEHDIQSRLSGLNAVMIERSNIVGKPMAQLLLGESCTMTFAHLRTKDPADIVRRADIVVAVVRRPEIVPGDWIMPGATVIEVGINRIERDGKKKLAGDADLASCSEVAGTRIPVPGGLGPMIVACLLANTPTACYRANDLDELEGLVA